jgi:hypothetical protein
LIVAETPERFLFPVKFRTIVSPSLAYNGFVLLEDIWIASISLNANKVLFASILLALTDFPTSPVR